MLQAKARLERTGACGGCDSKEQELAPGTDVCWSCLRSQHRYATGADWAKHRDAHVEWLTWKGRGSLGDRWGSAHHGLLWQNSQLLDDQQARLREERLNSARSALLASTYEEAYDKGQRPAKEEVKASVEAALAVRFPPLEAKAYGRVPPRSALVSYYFESRSEVAMYYGKEKRSAAGDERPRAELPDAGAGRRWIVVCLAPGHPAENSMAISTLWWCTIDGSGTVRRPDMEYRKDAEGKDVFDATGRWVEDPVEEELFTVNVPAAGGQAPAAMSDD